MKTQLIIALFAAAAAIDAHAASRTGAADYGQQVQPDAAERTVALTARTRWVNVVNGETVTFEEGGQRFTWHVQTNGNVAVFDLGRIAPAAMHAQGVKVYVAAHADA